MNAEQALEQFRAHRSQVEALAWSAATALAEPDWRVTVPAAVIAEFRALLTALPAPLDAELLRNIAMPSSGLEQLQSLATQLCRLLLQGKGLVHLQGLGGAGFSEPELRLFYLLLSMALGEMVTPYGRLHDVADRGYDFRNAEVSVSKTRVEAPFHTDSTSLRIFPNVVGLLCLRQAWKGGESMLVSACQVYLELEQRHAQHLLPLFEEHVRNTVTPGDETIDVHDNAFPVFSFGRFGRGPTLRYMRHWIETGYEKAGKAIPRVAQAAFDALDAELARPANVLELRLQPGEVLYINNATVAHNRAAFTDHPEPSRHRLLVRTWINAPDAR